MIAFAFGPAEALMPQRLPGGLVERDGKYVLDLELYTDAYVGTAKSLVAALDAAPDLLQIVFTGSWSVYGNAGGADIVLKATKVDGVYSADPKNSPQAELFERLGYDRVIESKLSVMDTNAIVLCRDQGMPIRVFNVFGEGNLVRLIGGESIGTLIS